MVVNDNLDNLNERARSQVYREQARSYKGKSTELCGD
jgi:hypothetical protein